MTKKKRYHHPIDSGRALAGLRGADTWVELDHAELLLDIDTVSEHLALLGLGRGEFWAKFRIPLLFYKKGFLSK